MVLVLHTYMIALLFDVFMEIILETLLSPKGGLISLASIVAYVIIFLGTSVSSEDERYYLPI